MGGKGTRKKGKKKNLITECSLGNATLYSKLYLGESLGGVTRHTWSPHLRTSPWSLHWGCDGGYKTQQEVKYTVRQTVRLAVEKQRAGKRVLRAAVLSREVSLSRDHSGKGGMEVRSKPCAQLWKGPGKARPRAEAQNAPTQPGGWGRGRVGAARVRS